MSRKGKNRRRQTRAGRAVDEQDYRTAIAELLKTTTAELDSLKQTLKSEGGLPLCEVAAATWALERLELMKRHLSAYTRTTRDENGDG